MSAKVPDYARIAHLEREIYGETFEHIGAPRVVSMFTNRSLTFIQPMVAAHLWAMERDEPDAAHA